MLQPIARILNAERGEAKPVLLLFGQGFFMGIFLYSYKIIAEALFLSRLSDRLAETMFISAALAVISTWLYSIFQNRISFSKLAFLSLFAILVFFGLIRFFFNEADDRFSNLLVFIMFALIQPVISVSLLVFWGIFGRIFDLRQSKRIIGSIDSGQLLAALVTSLSIPFLSKVIGKADFLLIGMGAILCCMGIFAIISGKYDLDQHRNKTGTKKVDTRIVRLLKDRYVVYLSFFLLLSIITFQFVHFSFLSVTEIYFHSESQLIGFLGYFNGSIMIFSLVIQMVVNERLIAMYGLKTAILTLPIVLLLFTAASIFAGAMFGFSGANANFIWFFLFIAMSKLFSESLRESLETSSFKLFFMPLDARIRFDIQAKVEGVINEFSRLAAGLLILIMGLLSFFELIHYSILLIAVIVVWIWSAGKLYSEYRNSIKKKLQGRQPDYELQQKNQYRVRRILDEIVRSDNPGHAIFALKLLEKLDLVVFRNYVVKLSTAANRTVRRFVLSKLDELNINSELKNGSPIETKAIFKNCHAWSDAMTLMKSEDSDNRKNLADWLGENLNDDNVWMLLALLADEDAEVKRAAISTAALAGLKETFPLLINNLVSPVFAEDVVSAFVKIGEAAFPALENAFYKSGQDIGAMLRILQIYGNVKGKAAIDLLWGKIDYPDKKISSKALLSLADCNFVADNTQARSIKYAIESEISNTAWNLKAVDTLKDKAQTNLIREALEYDTLTSIKRIFNFLSMLYDPHSVQLAQENLFGTRREGLTYAIELLDVFLSDDLKEKIIFLLNDALESKSLNKLAAYYAQNEMEVDETVRMIIHRDYNLLSRWTKSCAIHYVGGNRLEGFEIDLTANLFHPDRMIREASAWSLNQINRDAFLFHINRLDPPVRRELESINNLSGKPPKLTNIDKTIALKRIDLFSSIPGLPLSRLAEICEEDFLAKGSVLRVDHDTNDNVYVIYSGIMEIGSGIGKEICEGPCIAGGIELVDINEMVAATDVIVLMVEKAKFYDYAAADNGLLLDALENFIKRQGQIKTTSI